MNNVFDKGIEGVIGSAGSAAKKAFTNTVQLTGQQVGLSKGSAEGTAFESNTLQNSKPQSQQSRQNPLDPSAMQQQSALDQKKIEQVRQQLHTKNYFVPTFKTKPEQIRQRREQYWDEKNRFEEAKKNEMENIEEEKRKEYGQIALNRLAKGEIGKAGSG